MTWEVVQGNSGGFNATSGNATLAATTAGNTVILVLGIGSAGLSAVPTGFTQDSVTPVSNKSYVCRKSNVGAGETSWTITIVTALPVAWAVYEVAGLDPVFPVDVRVASYQTSTGTSQSTGTTPTSTTYDGLAVAVHLANNTASTAVPTWSSHTNSFVEETEQGQAGASTAVGMSVSLLHAAAPTAFTTTATASASLGLGSTMVVYSVLDAARVSNPEMLAGFEWGTTAGLGVGNSAFRLVQTVVGSPAIVTSTPRSGIYCLELSSTAATESVAWDGLFFSVAAQTAKALIVRVCFHFPGSLPAGDVELFTVIGRGGADVPAVVWFRSATSKLGCKLSTGTEQAGDATVTADEWLAVEVRLNGSAAAHTAEWQVDYGDGVLVPQTTATFTAGGASSAFDVRVGWATAATATVRYDDVIVSKQWGAFPLGDHKVELLTVDPVGTVTVSGTAGNFSTFTNNGTLNATFNGATARDAVDEVPPTIGGTADGFVQDTLAASDYVNLPMDTLVAAPDYAVRAVRMLACGWAATATAATIAFRFHDGVTETAHVSIADYNFDASTTAPAWCCAMCRPSSGAPFTWTQTLLDALALRVGFSNDATPVIGVHAIYAEVALQAAREVRVISMEDEAFTVDAHLDPATGGALGYAIATPVDRGATFTCEYPAGTLHTEVIPAGNSYVETVGSVDAALATNPQLTPDPTVDP